MDVFLIILSLICLLAGLGGCILPALPGPPVSYVGLLLLHFTGSVQFSAVELLVWLGLVVVAQVVDYFIPMLGSKYSGGSKWGSWGAFWGGILGVFFLPWGLVLGPFFGAVAGELLGDKDLGRALKSGVGSLLGFLFGTVFKVSLCIYFLVEFFLAIW